MNKCLIFISLLLLNLTLQAQIKPQSGFWRGTFTLAGGQESPFNFELKGTTAYLINGKERFELKGISQSKDSLFIPVDIYDGVLAAKIINKNTISGLFKRKNVTTFGAGISFKAEVSKRYRFFEVAPKAGVNLDGKWDVIIGAEKGHETVGVFEQKGSKVTGTFLTTTGDYRYYEGSVKGDEFFLSAFSGSSPSLFKGKISGDELTGEIVNIRGSQPVKGTRNDQAELPDAYSLAQIKQGTPFNFTFPDAFTGKLVSLKDAKYQGKAVIVTILGSWCPNCLDEASFLSPWFKANHARGVEIIGLSFERKNDPAFAKARLEVLKKRFGIEYDILFAGSTDKDAVTKALPTLSGVVAFPTTIFIDRKGEVVKVHTGYTGPATGKYYEEFIVEFNHEMDQLLKPVSINPTPKQAGK